MSIDQVGFYKVRKGYTFGARDQHKPGALVELTAGQARPFLGYQLEGPVDPPSPEEVALRTQALPDDFPSRETLATGGKNTYGDLMDMDDLTEIPGVGTATANKIKDAIRGATREAKKAALRAEDAAGDQKGVVSSDPITKDEQAKRAVSTPAPEDALAMPELGTVRGEERADTEDGARNINADPVAVKAVEAKPAKK